MVTCDSALTFDDGDGSQVVDVLPADYQFITYNGSVTVGGSPVSPAFLSPKDILKNWNAHYTQNDYSYLFNGTLNQIGAITWGPEAVQNPDEIVDLIPVPGSGMVDSALLFTARTGDIEFFLGTEQGATVGGSYTLSRSTGLSLVTRYRGEICTIQQLWMDDRPESPNRRWGCLGEITFEPYSFWPYPLNDGPTYDTATGNVIRPGNRIDSDGSTLTYLAQPT